jgi:hypothetical protein
MLKGNWEDHIPKSYVSVCPSRGTPIKFHKGIGGAKNSILTEGEGWLMQWENGVLTELSKRVLPELCPSCGSKTKKYEWESIPFEGMNVYESPVVCRKCIYTIEKDHLGFNIMKPSWFFLMWF